jgi:hypothetical protein
MVSHQSNKLPNASRAEVSSDKILGYLLCLDHPDGISKARFFIRFGFTREDWVALADALKQHGRTHAVTNVVESAYGWRYIVEGEITTPDGRNPKIRTVWVVEKGRDVPRLITAHPAKGAKQ